MKVGVAPLKLAGVPNRRRADTPKAHWLLALRAEG
jgi:hypothetical protein